MQQRYDALANLLSRDKSSSANKDVHATDIYLESIRRHPSPLAFHDCVHLDNH
jgi:hypothetical protein